MTRVAVKQLDWRWLVVGLGLMAVVWRVSPWVWINMSHLELVAAAMNDETVAQPETGLALTGLQARALAQLFPAKAETWLKTGVTDSSQMLTYLELCLWYWEQGRKEEAVIACREGQGTAVYWLREGIAAQVANLPAEAIDYFTMATQVEPESAEAWYRLAVMLQIEQRNEEALVAFQEAVHRGYPAYDSVGAIYLQLGQLEEARQVLLEGIAVHPEAQYTYLYLAQVAEAEEKWTEADDWYRQLTEVAPDYGPGFAGRGRISIRLGQYEQAILYFQQATQVEPGRISNWLDLGDAAARTHNTVTARTAYQQALVLEPDNQQAQAGLQALGQP